MRTLRFVLGIFIIALYSCGSSGQYYKNGNAGARPSEPGKCYAKCLMPDQYQETTVILPIYSGTDANIPLEKYIIVEGRKESKWVKKKADKNCLSANPDDCLVWCLEEIIVDEESVMYLSDTVAYKNFVLKEFINKYLVQEGGYTEWHEVICENKVSKSLILEIQTKLEEQGFNVGVIGPTGDLDFVTRKIIADYQRANGLPVGGLNINTLEFLGVNY